MLRPFFIALFLALFLSPASAYSDQTPAPGAPASPPKVPYTDFYRGLKQVTLELGIVPTSFGYAEACHIGTITDKKLCDGADANYAAFPRPLHGENLLKLIKQNLDQHVMPYLRPGNDGKKADLLVVDTILQGSEGYSNLQKMHALEKDKDTLTISALLFIDQTTTPKIALLHVKDYRWDPTYNYMSKEAPGIDSVIAIPLDMPEAEMEKRLEEFSEQSLFSNVDFVQCSYICADPEPRNRRPP